jgi:mediator of RNA polymerase II transcription subunit 21
VPGPEDTDPSNPRPLHPDSPATFSAAQRELARDLILKGAQIEYLVSVLPGLGTREEEQEQRIAVLEGELRNMERARKEKRREMRALVGRLEDVVMGVASSDGGRVVVTGSETGTGAA